MKLKKIASLMLAGVMAVSMLAGCSGKGTDGNEGGNVVNTDTLSVDAIVAEMDKDTTDKVDFSADASLQNALNKVLNEMGSNINNNNYKVATRVAEIADIDYRNDGKFDYSLLQKKDADSQTVIYASVIKAAGDHSEKWANAQFADMADQLVSSVVEHENSGMPASEEDEYYKYAYEAKVATAKFENSDGYTGYVAVVTLTATSSEAKVEL